MNEVQPLFWIITKYFLNHHLLYSLCILIVVVVNFLKYLQPFVLFKIFLYKSYILLRFVLLLFFLNKFIILQI
jgi:hypothetical protein